MATSMQIEWYKADEARRHNLAGEGLTGATIQESIRHNKVQEGIDITKNDLSRMNITETLRHNLQTEMLSDKDIGVKAYQAEENKRHNLAYERQQANELREVYRHNVVGEGISQANIGLGYANLDEVTRHNQAQESINMVGNEIGERNAATAELNAATAVDQYNQLVKEQNRRYWLDVINETASTGISLANALNPFGKRLGR